MAQPIRLHAKDVNARLRRAKDIDSMKLKLRNVDGNARKETAIGGKPTTLISEALCGTKNAGWYWIAPADAARAAGSARLFRFIT